MASHGNRPEKMQHMASLASSGVVGSHPNLTPNFSSMMEENDDYMDYTYGGSPLGLSSESSNQDRSCTSTPVGNDSSPAGESNSVMTMVINIRDGLNENTGSVWPMERIFKDLVSHTKFPCIPYVSLLNLPKKRNVKTCTHSHCITCS